MHGRLIILFIIALFLGGLSKANDLRSKEQSNLEVVMRMLGHQVLLSTGDSTSIVLPVKQEGDHYRIRFDTEFGFDPDRVSASIDSVIRATNISSNYIVEFVTCDSHRVVHSYKRGQEDDVIPCKGRTQPEACYELWISMLDADAMSPMESSIPLIIEPTESDDDGMHMFLLLLTVSAVLIVALFLAKTLKSSVQSNPNELRIGAFLFNIKNMELSINDVKIELTSKESDLLQLLSESANDTVERQVILNTVWGDEGDYIGRTLDVFISKLRKKLEADQSVRIVNVRGIGYKLVLSD